jgi:hypothetical protein
MRAGGAFAQAALALDLLPVHDTPETAPTSTG